MCTCVCNRELYHGVILNVWPLLMISTLLWQQQRHDRNVIAAYWFRAWKTCTENKPSWRGERSSFVISLDTLFINVASDVPFPCCRGGARCHRDFKWQIKVEQWEALIRVSECSGGGENRATKKPTCFLWTISSDNKHGTTYHCSTVN